MSTVLRKQGRGLQGPQSHPHTSPELVLFSYNVQVNICFVPKHEIFQECHHEQNVIGPWLRGVRDLEKTGLRTEP